MGSIISTIVSYLSACFRRITNSNGRERLQDRDIEEGKQQDTSIGPTLSPTPPTLVPTPPLPKLTPKRRALLVGISYKHSESDDWWPLENPHVDVDMFRSLLVSVYGYSPGEITVLKDVPDFPDHLQPTRENMIRELKSLVDGAASGDKFTFFYSGHSDQQESFDDISVEEDGQDEVIITSDIKRIVDNELNDILVKPLPADTFLLAVFDTCHSGTMLDLPHHHCNSVYVPWHSKGERVTMTMRNNNVRQQAMAHAGARGSGPPLPLIDAVIARDTDGSVRLPTDQSPSPSPQLRIDTKVKKSRSTGDSEVHPARGRRPQSGIGFMSPTRRRYDSPVSNVKCDGWCKSDPLARRVAAIVVISLFGPTTRLEGPLGSLTTVLCEYLKEHPHPSYRDMMSHINFALHQNARELHAYTRQQKKEGNGFDGEMDNFQEPNLSSLSKLNMDDKFEL
ncbi:caspase domain-containing protein [Lactarius quietus]|nr:caspase domain-containing protein [Lactarius quietus]